MTDAHDQKISHSYTIHYPAHPPREGDPHYKDFEAYRRRTKATAKCEVGEHRNDFSECHGGLELHHSHVEFSLQNGVDLFWLEVDYPGISLPDEVGAWVESAENLEWLCVLPGTPVLMADGSCRPIESVQPGEWVITHDGTPGRVGATSRKRYSGEIASFGGAAFTLAHRMLTSRGWLSAAEILHEVGVHGPNVVFLRGEQNQVSRSVVGSVAVEMVDALTGAQGAPDDLFHDIPVLKHPPRLAFTPNDHSDVAGLIGMATAPISASPFLPIEANDATLIRAVQIGPGAPMRRPVEFGSTGPANAHMRWIAPMLTRGLYNGWVHDLSVPHNHSFIAGGIAVHNCEYHHRGHGGVHVASASDFEAQKYVPGLIS